mmetsp:Transcript_9084/g.14907  ORF Transcript_9084/g.14907 Transcript_9084/m.14907 type:complete len:285 (+) Transcript_9084:215-1069(+)|eukprot:CAMPEP_0184651072 /NCGR_PEP_ID=MMETSP0308-20130426/8644_1 /TAXON_ID=38269 /ORGANISM="Gloeochaete witrockiana, Strain SAG 46.84" /LENGTH=284 /DNA_ID=CAMNT_0027085035 /DNA_START=160 /DNA_END=1014 /DNA_ORIENTATION=-
MDRSNGSTKVSPDDAVTLAKRRGFLLEYCSSNAKEYGSMNLKKNPLVIVMGWHGCKPRYLSKYTEWYKNEGFDTLSLISPGHYTFWPTTGRTRGFARTLLLTLHELHMDDRPIFFHSFSNGGCFVMEQALLLMQQAKKFAPLKKHIAGAIYDSCPAALSFRSAFNAMTYGSRNPLLYTAAFLLMACWSLQLLFHDRAAEYLSHMEQSLLTGPELYLYSKSDMLTTYKALDELVEKRKQRGVSVRSVRWDDSPHVSHFRTHYDDYVSALKTLIKDGLAFYALSNK